MIKLIGKLSKNIQNMGNKISIQDMENICPNCAKIMKDRGLTEVDILDAVSDWYKVEKVAGVGGDYPGAMPRQMARGLCKKFGADPGFFTRCEGSDLRLPAGFDKKAYCAELHKHCVGKWPRQGTHKKQMKLKFTQRSE